MLFRRAHYFEGDSAAKIVDKGADFPRKTAPKNYQQSSADVITVL